MYLYADSYEKCKHKSDDEKRVYAKCQMSNAARTFEPAAIKKALHFALKAQFVVIVFM